MRALVLHNEPEVALRLEMMDVPVPADGEALVRIRAAALNHRDQWIREGKYAKIQYPSVLGSDGCGVVESVGGRGEEWIGKEVIINPSMHWGDNERAQSPQYSIVGMPSQGTLAEYCVVPLNRLHGKPAHLTHEQAAALPLAGVTAWRALVTQGEVQAGHRVLVTGIGGGVARCVADFALAKGAHVYGTTGSASKRECIMALGVAGCALYTEEGWEKKLRAESGGMDVVIDGAGGDQINALLDVLRPGGRLVCYGATLGRPSSLNVQKVFWNQLRIQGTTMGSDADFAAMLEFVERDAFVPAVDSVYTLEQGVEAFDRMKRGEQFGKIVVSMAQ